MCAYAQEPGHAYWPDNQAYKPPGPSSCGLQGPPPAATPLCHVPTFIVE